MQNSWIYSGYTELELGMESAAWGGHEDLVRLCKEWGATEFDELAWMAAEMGNEELLRLCKEWGVTDFNYPMIFNQDSAALLCKEFGATEFDEVLVHAADSSNEQAVRLCKELGATDFNEAMITAVLQGDEGVVRLCIEFGADQIFEAIRQASEYWEREDLNYLFNIFKDIGKSCLVITCSYVGETIKVLFKLDVSADRVAKELDVISDSWDNMVQLCKESRPMNFNKPPKITVAYDNKFIIGLSLRVRLRKSQN